MADIMMSNYAKFTDMLRGLRLTDKRTGREIFRWQIFDNYKWVETAQQIRNNTHPLYEGHLKEGVSRKLMDAFSQN